MKMENELIFSLFSHIDPPPASPLVPNAKAISACLKFEVMGVLKYDFRLEEVEWELGGGIMRKFEMQKAPLLFSFSFLLPAVRKQANAL